MITQIFILILKIQLNFIHIRNFVMFIISLYLYFPTRVFNSLFPTLLIYHDKIIILIKIARRNIIVMCLVAFIIVN